MMMIIYMIIRKERMIIDRNIRSTSVKGKHFQNYPQAGLPVKVNSEVYEYRHSNDLVGTGCYNTCS